MGTGNKHVVEVTPHLVKWWMAAVHQGQYGLSRINGLRERGRVIVRLSLACKGLIVALYKPLITC